MNIRSKVALALATTFLWGSCAALADEVLAEYAKHDFLTDYSLLQPVHDATADYRYVSPTAFTDLANYDAIMVDQPEIFISPDSDYKGVKPDDLKAIADLMRSSLMERMEEHYNMVNNPGPGVLYLRLALTDLELVKKKRPILAFTPLGFVTYGTMQAAAKDLSKKVRLDYMTLELELTDSVTEEVLAAGLISRGEEERGEDTQIVSWEEFVAFLENLGKRIGCRMSNARLPEAQWEDCLAIKAELLGEDSKRGVMPVGN